MKTIDKSKEHAQKAIEHLNNAKAHFDKITKK